jgi:hypothetical protein
VRAIRARDYTPAHHFVKDATVPMRCRLFGIYCLTTLLSPGKFHKGSQGKNTFPVAGVFLAVQPAPWSRIVLAFRSVSSGRYAIPVALLVFSVSGFHRFFTTKPVSSETNISRFHFALITIISG